jgi:hypothetical protein
MGLEVQASQGSSLQPEIPVIAGLTLVATRLTGDTAFALYAVEREGLNLIEVSGVNGSAGAYALRLMVAGDVNSDGLVNGVDSQLIQSALGQAIGDGDYSLELDTNRDGVIGAVDLQIFASNAGFTANRPPVITPKSVLTHEDLAITISLENVATDPEGDTVYYRLFNPLNGTVELSGGGRFASFIPDAGYAGMASFELIGGDGFIASEVGTVTVNVSDAPLLTIDIEERASIVQVGERIELTFIGDFADQDNVILSPTYLDLEVEDSTIAMVSEFGSLVVQKSPERLAMRGIHG